MKLSLEQLVNSVHALEDVANLEFTIKEAWEISKAFLEIKKHLDLYEKNKNILLQKYAEPKKDETGLFNITPEYIAQHEELLALEVDIEINKVPLSLFGEKISPKKLINIIWLIDEIK